MSSLYQQFKSDNNLEREGILLQYGFSTNVKARLVAEGLSEADAEVRAATTIRIARAGGANSNFQKRMEHVVKPFRRQIQTETIDAKQAEKLVRQVYAETVVLGWENVDDAEGNPMPYSVENCKKLFDDLPDLFADIQEQAQRAALFRAEIRESTAGN